MQDVLAMQGKATACQKNSTGSNGSWSGHTACKEPKLSGQVASFWSLALTEMNTNGGGLQTPVNATVFKLAVGVSDIAGV